MTDLPPLSRPLAWHTGNGRTDPHTQNYQAISLQALCSLPFSRFHHHVYLLSPAPSGVSYFSGDCNKVPNKRKKMFPFARHCRAALPPDLDCRAVLPPHLDYRAILPPDLHCRAVLPPDLVGTTLWPERVSAAHLSRVSSAVRKQRERCCSAGLLLCIRSKAPSRGMMPPQSI